MLDTDSGDNDIGYKNTKGIPIAAVIKCPIRIPLILDFSSALLVVINIEAKNKPAIMATIFPSIFPEDNFSRKNREIPIVVKVTATISPSLNFWWKIKADKMIMKIGAVYCKTIAFAEVVSLLAVMKNIKVPDKKMPHKNEYLLNTKPDFIYRI
ncbi:MAG: hypothetical protein WCF96_03260 [Eubacteriales bacterium]